MLHVNGLLLSILSVHGGLRQPAYPISKEQVAFAMWMEGFGTTGCGTRFQPYSHDAQFVLERYGQVISVTKGGADITQKICGTFKSTPGATAGLINVEHCDGVWRGSFTPFINHWVGNATVHNEMDSIPSGFVIWGHLNASGYFVADLDHTCLGYCDVSYDWNCSAREAEPAYLVSSLAHRISLRWPFVYAVSIALVLAIAHRQTRWYGTSSWGPKLV